MGVKFDFSDVDGLFEEIKSEVSSVAGNVGKEAVEFAKQNGSYQDQTGVLRASNKYTADQSGLTLENEAEYASYVEAKGYEVLSSAALFAKKKLNE